MTIAMKKSKFTEAQIVFALQQAESGVTVAEVCRKLGISDTTVKVHIKNLLRKLNLTSRLEAAVWKYQNKPKD